MTGVTDTSTVEDKAPPTVPQEVHDLIALGGIKGIRVEYRQTGVDSAETYWVITGWSPGYNKTEPKLTLLGREAERYLTIKPDHASIAFVKDEWYAKWETRKDYEKKHEKELAEYRRLQKKYGGKDA